MESIKEPKNVDFYVIDKPWSEDEKKEFSKLIRKIKAKSKTRKTNVSKKSKAA